MYYQITAEGGRAECVLARSVSGELCSEKIPIPI